MKNVVEKSIELGNDLENVKKELKRLQSVKCRLLKQKARKDYESLMTDCLKEEQLVKEVRNYLEPKKLTVTVMTEEQIKNLNYDETVRAIKSIQSKKCLTQYEEDQVNYKDACRIEEMLKNHRETMTPSEKQKVTLSKVDSLAENIANLDKKSLTKEWLLEQLENLKK